MSDIASDAPWRVAIIGGSGGIGRETARRLVERGAEVMIGGRDAARLEEAARETGATPHFVDGCDAGSVDRFVTAAVEAFGGIDGAVNLAGSMLLKPASTTSTAEWRDTLAVNLDSAFYLVRAAVRVLKPGSAIVLCSSCAAQVGLANHEAIAAAKGGVAALARSAAATYAPRGIRVNAVAPGLVRTPLSARLLMNAESLKASVSMHPAGRIGEPADVAAAILYLLDPNHSWVTGQVLETDGGLAALRSRAAA